MFGLILGLLFAGPPVDPPKLPPELEHIVQLANASPPEFASNAMLRVAAITKIDAGLRKDLIDRAFHTAAGAQLHTPLITAAQLADTNQGMLAAASRLNLDTLSLQTRAVKAMLNLDKKAARDLFLEISQPSAAPSCDQPLNPDVAPLYDALAAVANQTFTDKERKKEEHINLVLAYVSRAASPAEVAPIEQMIASLAMTPEQHDVLTTRLNGLKQSLIALACPNEAKPLYKFWTSDRAKQIFEGGIRLRNTDASKRDTPEWYEQLADYLKDVNSWTSSDEKDEAAYFHQKAIVYEMLVELIPRGPERDKAVLAFVDFVANSGLQREQPAEWFSHAESLITRVGNLNLDPAKVWTAFEESGNPTLVLYTRLNRLAVSQR